MNRPLIQESLPLAYDADGVIRIGSTRIPLDTVVAAFQDGETAEEIAQQYPSLTLADVYQTIGYYLSQPVEISRYLQERDVQANEIRQQNESRFDPHGIRERLLSRLPEPIR